MSGIDWQAAKRKGKLTHALHLFACRLAWLRHGDERAHHKLIRASAHADPEIRAIAARMLFDQPTETSGKERCEQEAARGLVQCT